MDNLVGLKRTTAPTVEPLTPTEAKAFLRVTNTDDDTLIAAIIKSARDQIENATRRALLSQVWTMTLSHIPCSLLQLLPRPALISVDTVKYYDTENAQQTLSSDYYEVTNGDFAEIYFDSDNFPDTSDDIREVWEIVFTAGYGTASTDIPESILAAMRLLVTQMYDERGTDVKGLSENGLSQTVNNLLGAHYAPVS